MKFKRKRKDKGGIPQASLSDISFCLLVFFLATTTFDIKKGLSLMLPPPSKEGDKKVKLKDENIAKVFIDEQGRIAINEQEVPKNSLKGKIRKMVLDNPKLVISLKTHRQSDYKNMVEVLDILRDAGAEKISLSTN